jgi:S-adenosylmethionine decarboxylase
MIAKSKRSIQWIKQLNAKRRREYIGTHFVADFWNGRIIEDEKELQDLLIEAVKEAKCVPLKSAIHKFSPQGITGVMVLSESHLSIHTWPERNYIAIDVFTCGNTAEPEKAIEYLRTKLNPKKVKIRKIKRGKIS